MNRRIDFNRYDKPPAEAVSGGMITGALKEVISDSLRLQEVLKLVEKDANVYWVSNGDWSMHQMLLGILNITGPAHVTISSYAMSETPARILAQLKDQGNIITLKCVLDDRVDVRSPGALQLIKSIADAYAMIKTHAKVTLIQNEDWQISVVGSANYTENKRYEAGMITTSYHVFDMNYKWISKTLHDGAKH